MGVALDVHVSPARWRSLKNMNADAWNFGRSITARTEKELLPEKAVLGQ